MSRRPAACSVEKGHNAAAGEVAVAHELAALMPVVSSSRASGRMATIADAWDAAVRADVPAYARLVPESEARGTVLRPGARPAEIEAAEARLGVRLPEAYRSFLLVSDGADAGPFFGADQLHRLHELPRGGLLRVSEVGRFIERAPGVIELWHDAMSNFAAEQELPHDDAPVHVVDFGPGREALLVSPPVDDENLVAVIPALGEGQVWEFRHDDVVAFTSFAAFLHDLTRRARASVEQRAARLASGGDPNPRRRIIDLAHAGDPLAIDLACRAFTEPSTPDEQRFAANHLSMIGSPRAIPTLRAALQNDLDPTIRLLVLFALDSCGDRDAVPDLRRFLDELDPRPQWAADLLDRRDSFPRW